MPGHRRRVGAAAQILLHSLRHAVPDRRRSSFGCDELSPDIALWTQLQKDGARDAGRGLALAQAAWPSVLFWNGKYEQALQLFERAQATMEAVGPGDSPKDYAVLQARIELDNGDTLNWLGRNDQAQVRLQDVELDQMLALRRAFPDDPTVINFVALAYIELGNNMINQPDKAPMLAAYQMARKELAGLVAADPADMRAKRQLALCDQEVGDALVSLKQFDEAMQHYDAALRAEQGLVANNPHDETTAQDLANTWYGIGGLQQEREQVREALASFGQALKLREALRRKYDAAALQRDVAQVYSNIAALEHNPKQACPDWIRSDAMWRKLAAEGIAAPTDQTMIAMTARKASACH